MTDTIARLRSAVDDVMMHQWSHRREAMQALTDLVDAAEAGAREIDRQRGVIRDVNARCDSLGMSLRDIKAERDEAAVEVARLLYVADENARLEEVADEIDRLRAVLAELVRIYVHEGAAVTPVVEIGAAWDAAVALVGKPE